MAAHERSDDQGVAVIEALETLTSIADLDLETEGHIVEKDELVVQDHRLYYRTFDWQGRGDEVDPPKLIKKTLQVILKYLRVYCRKEHGFVTDRESIEGIKSIMVLVGESARKLDRFTNLFHDTKAKRVSGLAEYKKLQELYHSRVAHRIDTRMLGQWILGLAQTAVTRERTWEDRKAEEAKHVFVDLETVKGDTEYELFFMRKDDGSRFFNPRLIRNMKLVCDFGEAINVTKKTKEDPFLDLDLWHDRSIQTSSKDILKALETYLNWFYHDAMQYKHQELVAMLNRAVMSLMLSANTQNLLENDPAKCCSEYFLDFQEFLGKALQARDYQKYLVYPPKKTSKFTFQVLDFIHAICQAVYVSMDGYREMLPVLKELMGEQKDYAATENPLSLCQSLVDSYDVMIKLVKQHPHGPLTKVLDFLHDGACHVYDPLHQDNIPQTLYSFFLHDAKITNVRVPTPTVQEFVNKVALSDEFKGFLMAKPISRTRQHHLLINMQDRTSWKEHARCLALEELQFTPEFANKLTVVTLAKDSDFYYQMKPYDKDNESDVFISHFLDHLQDENAGFYFPDQIKEVLFPEFTEELMGAIHRVFFSSKNVLTVEQRLDFIEVFYLFLQLKLLELAKPDTFSFTCKDAIDSGGAASVELLAFLMLLNNKEVKNKDLEPLLLSLHVPPLLIRGRGMLPDRFLRMMNVLKLIEFERDNFGYDNFRKIVDEGFSHFFEDSLLNSKIIQS